MALETYVHNVRTILSCVLNLVEMYLRDERQRWCIWPQVSCLFRFKGFILSRIEKLNNKNVFCETFVDVRVECFVQIQCSIIRIYYHNKTAVSVCLLCLPICPQYGSSPLFQNLLDFDGDTRCMSIRTIDLI